MKNSYLNVEELEAYIGKYYDINKGIQLFYNNIDILKNHTFIFLNDNISTGTNNNIPEYMNKESDGICVSTLAAGNRCFILNKKSVLVAIKQDKYNFNYSFGFRLDTNMMNYLSSYYEGERDIPKHFLAILKKRVEEGFTLDCMPYIFENFGKLNDAKIEKGVYKSLLPFIRFCESGFEKFSVDYPFSKSEHLKVTEMIREYEHSIKNNLLTDSQKYIYAMFLKTAIINFTSKAQIKKKLECLLEFVNNKLGLLFELEFVICYWFLKDRNDDRIKKFFKAVQQNNKEKILNVLSGMAWDVFHLRGLSTTMGISEDNPVHLKINNVIYIDALVTQDKGLINIIKAYPIKCIIYKKGDLVAKIIWKYGIEEIVNEIDFFEKFQSNLEIRRNTYKEGNINVLIQELEVELKQTLNS